jgi:hypothetical protein
MGFRKTGYCRGDHHTARFNIDPNPFRHGVRMTDALMVILPWRWIQVRESIGVQSFSF